MINLPGILGVHSAPRKCSINDAADPDDELCGAPDVYELILNGLSCNSICYVGDVTENGNTV